MASIVGTKYGSAVCVDRLRGINYSAGGASLSLTDSDGAQVILSADAVAHILSVVTFEWKRNGVEDVGEVMRRMCCCLP